mgnify:CR=1 FL=1
MNNKGFTLVELIAILGLMTIIILVGAPNLINQIESQKNKNYDNFVSDLCLATESYINHSSDVDTSNFKEAGDTLNISVGSLMSNGYIKSNTKNPRTKQNLDSTDTITVTLTEDLTYTCTLNN